LIVPHNYSKYQQASEQMKKIVKKYDSSFKSFSLDEVSFDITDYLENSNPSFNDQMDYVAQVVNHIRKEIFDATNGLTCSAGVASSRPLAKLCSNMNKPDGSYCLSVTDRDKIMEFLNEQPVKKLFGVGKVTSQILKELLDVENVKQLWDKRYHVYLLFGGRQYEFLITSCLALDIRDDGSPSSSSFLLNNDKSALLRQKSCSVERTVSKAIKDFESACPLLRELSELLEKDLKNENLCGKIIGIKIKTSDFNILTRMRKLGRWIWSTDDFYNEAEKLLKKEFKQDLSIRLLGLKIDCLQFRNLICQDDTIDKFIITSNRDNNSVNGKNFSTLNSITCPNCPKTFDSHENLFVINDHIDKCIDIDIDTNDNNKNKSTDKNKNKRDNVKHYTRSKKSFSSIAPISISPGHHGNLDKFLNKNN